MFDSFIKEGVIEPEELQALLESGAPVKLIDATFVMPGSGHDVRAQFQKERIDSAVLFDIDEIADHNTELPHMLPAPEEFECAVTALGISNNDLVVAYAQHGMVLGPARAWWMFRVFGHDKVCVLNGGLPAWKAAGLPLNTNAPEKPKPAVFRASFRSDLVCDMNEVKAACESGSCSILDARAAARFEGEAAEPRAGLASGHIPGSYNLPSSELVDAAGKLKSKTEIEKLLQGSGIREGRVINTCGSGVTACMTALALHHTGRKDDIAVYDGSWTEWGDEKLKNPVVRHKIK